MGARKEPDFLTWDIGPRLGQNRTGVVPKFRLKVLGWENRVTSQREKGALDPTVHGMQPARLLCQWNFPGKNTRVGYHILLQEIFPTKGLNSRLLCLLHWQVGSLPVAPVTGNQREEKTRVDF